MTTPKPLNASPLAILNHRFTRIEVVASAEVAPDGGISLATSRSLQQHSENPRHWQLTLDLQFGSRDGDEDAPYQGGLTIEGEFVVVDAYPDEKVDQLVNITGASILYGACREMLANLTARSSHGIVSLPSVSFLEPPAGKEPRKKAPRKKAVSKKLKDK